MEEEVKHSRQMIAGKKKDQLRWRDPGEKRGKRGPGRGKGKGKNRSVRFSLILWKESRSRLRSTAPLGNWLSARLLPLKRGSDAFRRGREKKKGGALLGNSQRGGSRDSEKKKSDLRAQYAQNTKKAISNWATETLKGGEKISERGKERGKRGLYGRKNARTPEGSGLELDENGAKFGRRIQ